MAKKLIIVAIPIFLAAAGSGGYFAWMRSRPKPIARKVTPAKRIVAPTVRRVSTPILKSSSKPKTTPLLLDDAAGAAKVAKLWNAVDTPKLLRLTSAWSVKDLAPVAMRMDAGKVAEMLAFLSPRRASDLSREVRRLASLPEPD